MSLAHLLDELARHGFWIETWKQYPDSTSYYSRLHFLNSVSSVLIIPQELFVKSVDHETVVANEIRLARACIVTALRRNLN